MHYKGIMKQLLIFLISVIFFVGCSNEKNVNKNAWSKAKRSEHLENIKDSTTWDLKLFVNDKRDVDLGDIGPFEVGTFPVPKYDLVGIESFKGLGSKGGIFHIGSKNLLMNSFYIMENELNKDRLNGGKDEIFFQILILTDTIDDTNYNLSKSIAISRNHPDYLGQGFLRTKNNRIDYMAFQTAENNAYAIINTRIFDLNFGKTVLIAPQKDRTLKSLQIQSPKLTFDSILKYTEDLIESEEIIEFFEKKGTI